MPMRKHAEVGALPGIVNSGRQMIRQDRLIGQCRLDSLMPEKTYDAPRHALKEAEMARAIDVSPSWLAHDRTGARRIPFYRIGGLVRYNPARVFEALAQMEEGGAPKRKGAAA